MARHLSSACQNTHLLAIGSLIWARTISFISLSHRGEILTSFWTHGAIIVGPFWRHVGAMWASFWDHLGIMLDSYWHHLGIILTSCSNDMSSFRIYFEIILARIDEKY